MVAADWTDKDTARALQFWESFQAEHDLIGRHGQTAGIDPATGRVWFGESALDIAEQMEAEGGHVPFYAVRVGADYYLRKGGRRDSFDFFGVRWLATALDGGAAAFLMWIVSG